MELISRVDAKAQGLKRYFTGLACKNGHVSERFVSAGDCCACQTERNQKPEAKAARAAYAKTPEGKDYMAAYRQTPEAKANMAAYNKTPEAKAAKAAHYKKNADKIAARTVAYAKTNAEKIAVRKAAYRKANTDKIAAYVKANADKIAARDAAYRKANADKIAARMAAYTKANAAAYAARNAQRRAAKLQRTPKWLTPADKAAIKAIYEQANFTRRVCGEPMHVDHIIPLQGETVSGLHVPLNLQILTATENITKSNKLLEQFA